MTQLTRYKIIFNQIQDQMTARQTSMISEQYRVNYTKEESSTNKN